MKTFPTVVVAATALLALAGGDRHSQWQAIPVRYKMDLGAKPASGAA